LPAKAPPHDAICQGIPISVPTALKKSKHAGGIPLRRPEMMTDDAKFALGF
jgi:hypothetical protein